LRILLPGAQMLTAFLIILPVSGGARQIILNERLVFMATFFFALTSLPCHPAPPDASADQPRALQAPGHAPDRGLFGKRSGNVASGVMALLIGGLWCFLPMYLKRKHGF
jgi:hypothetical protein